MWWLLKTMCFVHILGNTLCLPYKKYKNPEANMNTKQIISYWGYPSEVYEVYTKDGYILEVCRIPHGKNKATHLGQKPVVYLQHGFLATAGIWVANLPSNSLGFMLADAGYDVWMGNSRGNTWSKRHLYLDTDSKEFWTFSYDEMIKYDLPATIDFILEETRQKQIYYVGHSQGTLIAFGAFATNPQLAQKIKISFVLGPIATAKYIAGGLQALSYLPPGVFKLIFGEKEILPYSHFNDVTKKLCNYKIFHFLCNSMFTFFFGYDRKNLNESRYDVYLQLIPSGSSVQNLLHYFQAIHTGTFQAYDYGSASLNFQHYNQSTPPEYNVENMKVPTAMWSGGRDPLADPRDVQNLERRISNLIYNKEISYYNHNDFLIGKDAPTQVFSGILKILSETKGD
ncbi:tear acid lipase-like protein [Dipodomys spectabilis]|uniref:tear acid lipase-like protein n=1 Tax=Dipodomys spectabilis TaxID=105255 RepID=UPI001C541450|nr:tear acid lipase-like protein [Dipodomys spectabilis]